MGVMVSVSSWPCSGKAGLQPEDVPGSQAAGSRAGLGQPVPDGHDVGRPDGELKPIPSGVAGASDENAAAVDVAAAPGEGAQQGRNGAPARVAGQARAGGEVLAKLVNDVYRLGPLHGKEAGEHGAVGDMHAASIEVLGELAVEPEAHGGTVAGVGNEQEFVLGETVEDGVVDDAAPLVADEAVAGAAHAQAGRGAGEENVQQTGGVGSADVQPAHVRDVEQAGGVAYTAATSAMTPSYCTGMSQPPKGTMRAPRATWAS